MSRHILTPEERVRGHKLTDADRRKGGRNVPRAKRAKAALANPTHLAHLIEMGTRYRLTSERARELALKSAQVRRERRLMDLLRAAGDAGVSAGPLGKPNDKLKRELQAVPMSEAYPDHEERDPSLMGPRAFSEHAARVMEQREGLMERLAARDAEYAPTDYSALKSMTFAQHSHPISDPTRVIVQPDGCVGDARALGASLADKLMEPRFTQPGPMGGPMSAPIAKPRVQADPFTLSALKRFRLGPRSPLELTRSQRAHVDIMREQGFLTVTGDSMLALTEKGRQAIETEEVNHG